MKHQKNFPFMKNDILKRIFRFSHPEYRNCLFELAACGTMVGRELLTFALQKPQSAMWSTHRSVNQTKFKLKFLCVTNHCFLSI